MTHLKKIIFTSFICVICFTTSAAQHKPECLFSPEKNGLCKTGFVSNCRSALFCSKQRKSEAAQVCASHQLDIPADRGGLIKGCYFGTATCYCKSTDSIN
ncbi:hypothetical protein [Parashewanella curva]|nr:hypothetical protein [Parashewanella curva]